jgi:hypothetical protein
MTNSSAPLAVLNNLNSLARNRVSRRFDLHATHNCNSHEPPKAIADPDLWLYRDRTVGLLKRYMRMSVEVGRLPSLLGREFFRTRVTSYSVSTFEDAVIFVYDVERSLEKLDPFEQRLIAILGLQDYSQDQAAQFLNCGRRTIVRRYPETLDRLSAIFLNSGILTRLPGQARACQELAESALPASHTIRGRNIRDCAFDAGLAI